jgi:hypothetical protein
MHILLTAGAMLLAAFAVHLVIWKIRVPKNQTVSLLVISATIFCVWLVSPAARGAVIPDLLRIALCYLSVSLSYISIYSVIEMDSPTLSLMCYLVEGGREGIEVREAARFLGRRPFFQARMAALIASGLIEVRGDNYVVAGKGSIAFRVILGFRKIYGSIPQGG